LPFASRRCSHFHSRSNDPNPRSIKPMDDCPRQQNILARFRSVRAGRTRMSICGFIFHLRDHNRRKVSATEAASTVFANSRVPEAHAYHSSRRDKNGPPVKSRQAVYSAGEFPQNRTLQIRNPRRSPDETLALGRRTLRQTGRTIRLWRMPLWPPYDAWLDSKVANINNAPSGTFRGLDHLRLCSCGRFVEDATSWLHVDIYGWTPSARPARPRRGGGMPGPAAPRSSTNCWANAMDDPRPDAGHGPDLAAKYLRRQGFKATRFVIWRGIRNCRCVRARLRRGAVFRCHAVGRQALMGRNRRHDL